MTATRRIFLSEPMPHQFPVLLDPARFKVLKCGRRWGKTEGIGDNASLVGHGPFALDDAGNPVPRFKGALYGGHIWRVLPVYEQAEQMWDRTCEILSPVWLRKKEEPPTIWLPGGGTLSVRSADRPKHLRGPGLTGLLLDEIKDMPASLWQDIRPALMDQQGWAVAMGTPSEFEDATLLDVFLWHLAEGDADWKRWKAPSSENPLNTPRELAKMRRELGESGFRRECLVEYAGEGEALFRREWQRFYDDVPTLVYRFGTADLAATDRARSDWSVISSWGVTADGRLCLLKVRRGRLDGAGLLAALKEATEEDALEKLYIEAGAASSHIISIAKREGVPVESVKPDRSKKVRAEPAAAAMERGQVWFPRSAPWLATFQAELFAFTGKEEDRETDDQVDTLSYAVLRFLARTIKRTSPRPPRGPSTDGGWLIGRG